MSALRRPFQVCLAIVLMLVTLGPASSMASTAVPPASAVGTGLHPAVAHIAAQSPAQTIAVIVQKTDASDMAEALVARLGGTVTKDLRIINAFVAEMSAEAARQLAASPSVRWVSPDGELQTSGKKGGDTVTATTSQSASYFLDTLRVRDVWALGLKGQGVGIAVIDSGVAADADFGTGRRSRLIQVSVNPSASSGDDVYGHGTHVAGIIAGSGADSGGAYAGIAPEATLIGVRISDDQGRANESDAVAAMQWVLDHKTDYNIRVVNLSINSALEQSYHTSPLSAAAEILWFNGVVVVASAGNLTWQAGYNPVNTAPANDPFVITVGASMETQAWLGAYGLKVSDYEAPFSAHGVTADGFAKPDLLAPGTSIISVLAPKSPWVTEHPDRLVNNGQYIRLSGTSMSTPMVAGAVALLLQDEPTLTPDQVKYRLTHMSRTVMGWDGENQVAYPYLDVYAAVTGTSTESANDGRPVNQLLFSGSSPLEWSAVNWNAVNWNAVNWTAVNWNAVNWNAVNWTGIAWND